MDPNNNTNNIQQDNSSSTVSDLPILFANGYPISLERMSESQLSIFIPFLLKCSQNAHVDEDELQMKPAWWPENVEYLYPFSKPKSFNGNWELAMKEIVERCYHYNNSIFLLKYSSDLSDFEPECLRFVNNNNSTTSLYNRLNKKLLLTFKNENMLYDKKDEGNRKCLLPKRWNSSPQQSVQNMVEPNMFDIYLCDNCDAELYSEDAYAEHEKSCYIVISDDDEDVDEPMKEIDTEKSKETQKINDFMLNFGLQSVNNRSSSKGVSRLNSNTSFDILSPEKAKRISRRARNTLSFAKCHLIPFSSPCGIMLKEKVKNLINEDYYKERLDRIERFCPAPVYDKHNKPKFIKNNPSSIYTTCSTVTRNGSMRCDRENVNEHYLSFNGPLYYKSRTCKYRNYKYPHRQFRSASYHENFTFINKPLIKTLKPCSVNVRNLATEDIESLKEEVKKHHKNHKNVRDIHREKFEKLNVVECIDLCSSDGEGDENEPVPSSQHPAIQGLPTPPSHRIDGNFLSTPLSPGNTVRRNIFSDSLNRMSALSGSSTSQLQSHSRQLQGQTTVLRQSTYLFSECNGNSTANQENMSNTKRSQIKNWLQSVDVDKRALVKLT